MEENREAAFKSSKRDRLEIVSAIIAIAQQPSSTTRLTCQANLSYSLLKEYSIFMIGKHLIEECEIVNGSRKKMVYKATERGNRFLRIYCEGLFLLHGEAFLQSSGNLAAAYLLEYCRKNKVPLRLRAPRSAEGNIESDRDSRAASYANLRKDRSRESKTWRHRSISVCIGSSYLFSIVTVDFLLYGINYTVLLDISRLLL